MMMCHNMMYFVHYCLTGVVNVSMSAEAVASHASCDNEIVSVPERGRIDVVTRSLIVKVSALKEDEQEMKILVKLDPSDHE